MQERLRSIGTLLFPPRVLMAIEDGAVTVMALQGKGREARAALLRTVPLPRGACVEGLPMQRPALGDLIGDLLVELGLIGAEVVAALPAAACAWRLVEWPFEEWPEEPGEALRQIDPDLGLPYPLSSAYVGLLPLPVRPLTSLLVTVPRELLQGWIDVFDIAGVSLERLEPAQICELRALESILTSASPGHLFVLVEVQPSGGRITLVREGVPEYARTVRGTASDLGVAVQRCVAWWRQRDPAARAVRVLVFGSGAGLSALAESLSRLREWAVETIDPLQRGWLPPVPALAEQLRPADAGSANGSATSSALVTLSGLAQVEFTP